LLDRLDEARQKLTPEEDRRLVLDMIRDDIFEQLERYVTEHLQQVIVAVENWWDKYYMPFDRIKSERDYASQRLTSIMGKGSYGARQFTLV
jgi:type I restriction enzyme M protein